MAGDNAIVHFSIDGRYIGQKNHIKFLGVVILLYNGDYAQGIKASCLSIVGMGKYSCYRVWPSASFAPAFRMISKTDGWWRRWRHILAKLIITLQG